MVARSGNDGKSTGNRCNDSNQVFAARRAAPRAISEARLTIRSTSIPTDGFWCTNERSTRCSLSASYSSAWDGQFSQSIHHVQTNNLYVIRNSIWTLKWCNNNCIYFTIGINITIRVPALKLDGFAIGPSTLIEWSLAIGFAFRPSFKFQNVPTQLVTTTIVFVYTTSGPIMWQRVWQFSDNLYDTY